MLDRPWFTSGIDAPDPRMRRALDNWLGAYESCHAIAAEMRKGLTKKHSSDFSQPNEVAEPPGAYGIASHRSPGPEHLFRALLSAARCLNDLGAFYVVGGGMAMGFHGRERATKDVDFFVLEHHEKLGSIVASFKTRDLFPHSIEQPSFTPPHALFYWSPFQYGLPDAPPVDVDLLSADHKFMAFLHASGCEVAVAGVPFRVLSAEGLLLLKLQAYRDQDKADLLHLLRANAALDRALLEVWVRKFKLEDRFQEMETKALEFRRFG